MVVLQGLSSSKRRVLSSEKTVGVADIIDMASMIEYVIRESVENVVCTIPVLFTLNKSDSSSCGWLRLKRLAVNWFCGALDYTPSRPQEFEQDCQKLPKRSSNLSSTASGGRIVSQRPVRTLSIIFLRSMQRWGIPQYWHYHQRPSLMVQD